MKIRWLGLTALVLALPAIASAEARHYETDPVHSEVGFTIRHLVAKTTGRFDEFQGHITLDPANLAETLQIKATIQAASVDTNNDDRDGHLKSPDFFEVEKYPEMTFESTSVTQDGDDYVVKGNMTIKGVTKEIELELEFGGAMMNPMAKTPTETIGLDLEGKINRKDFNIEWNKQLDAGGFILGDEVKIVVHLEASGPIKQS